MKKHLLFLLATVALMEAGTPAARAYEKNPWDDTKHILDELYPQMDDVYAKMHRYGASHEVRDEIVELRQGIRDVSDHVANRDMDGREVYRRAQALHDLMGTVQAQYSGHIQHMREEEHRDRW